MAEMYVNGKGEEIGSSDLKEHCENVRVSQRTKEQQMELDLIWGEE